ncbi:MAG: NAD-dependent epimerase/dehydratase family protein [Deltaproteobacteria bacterium]|jgi:UDP-glucose 4-epimerase|nr:NAD-dependent epimerase/dehydratase family protein [Deltaproteobacteria bacterium]
MAGPGGAGPRGAGRPAAVLVTGGAGFIGSHLVERLAGAGHRVRVLDDLSSGREDNLAAVRGDVTLTRGSVLDPGALGAAMEGVRAVFHLAARPSVPESLSDPGGCLETNGRGTLNVLALAAKLGVGRLVYASSSAVYGDLPAPHAEDAGPRPNNPYAAVKLLGEHLAEYHRLSLGLPAVSLRFFNVYGPRQSADGADAGVVPIFADRLARGLRPVVFGDGLQTRDFVHVRDAARALALAADYAGALAGGGAASLPAVFNVASGRSYTLLEVLEFLRAGRAPDGPRLEPVFEPARPGDPRISEAAVGLAAERLGFAAEISLAEGLAGLAAPPGARA